MDRKTKLFIKRVGGASLLYLIVILLGRIYFPDQLGIVIIFIIISIVAFAATEHKIKKRGKK